MSIKSVITGGGDGLFAKVRRYLDSENRLCVDSVIDTAVQDAVPVTFGPGGGLVPIMQSLHYDTSIGAIVAQHWRRVITYVAPTGYNAQLIRYTSYQSESANSRVITELNMGTLNIITNVYSCGGALQNYDAPQFTSVPQLEITQQIGGAADVTVSLDYTNEYGISSRTATCVITKNSIVGGRWDPVLQAGDLGIRSVQSMVTVPTSASGAVKLLGFTKLGYHSDSGTTTQETMYSPGAVSVGPSKILGVEFQGGAVAKVRHIDILMQLTSRVSRITNVGP